MSDKKGTNSAQAQWLESAVNSFVETCYDYFKKGDLQSSTFKAETWGKINEELRRLIDVDYGTQTLKGKWNRMRRIHRMFQEVLAHTGVTRDREANKRHRDYDKFKTKGCLHPRHYEILSRMFDGTMATGGLSNPSIQPPPMSDEERQMEDDFLTRCVNKPVDNVNENENEPSGRRRHRKEAMVNKSNKLEACLEQWSSSMTAKNEERA